MSATFARRVQRLALRATDPELASIVALAEQPLDLDTDAAPSSKPCEGWPLDWPRDGDTPKTTIDPGAIARPWETPHQAGRRVTERRRTLTAASDDIVGRRIVVDQRAQAEVALAVLDSRCGHHRAALIASGIPARTEPKTAKPYRGGRGFLVSVRDKAVLDRGGRTVRGVRVASNGELVAAAAPPRDENTTVLNRLAAALERLVARPQPPINVHVEAQPAPVVNVTPPNVVVHVPEQRPRSVRVEYDKHGVKRYVSEDV